MDKEKFIEIKEGYLNDIKSMLLENESLSATITIIGEERKSLSSSIVHIPLPEKIINSDEGKQMFVDVMIPEISKKINEKFSIYAVAWASEAWMREAPVNDYNPEKDNYKDLPIKKEILIITIDTEIAVENHVYEIVRMSIGPNGDLVEKLDLVELPEMSKAMGESEGRFSGLYKKFTV
jgi:hypothetical protein